MSGLITTLDRLVGKIEYTLLIGLTASLTMILAAQVVLRYFFNSPLFWAEEVAVQILISATFIGVSYMLHTNQLVRVDLLLVALRGAAAVWVARLLNLVVLATLLVLCYYATDWILRPEIKADVSPTTGLPRWYNYGVLVGAFYCMCWHQLIQLLCPPAKPVFVEEAAA